MNAATFDHKESITLSDEIRSLELSFTCQTTIKEEIVQEKIFIHEHSGSKEETIQDFLEISLSADKLISKIPQ